MLEVSRIPEIGIIGNVCIDPTRSTIRFGWSSEPNKIPVDHVEAIGKIYGRNHVDLKLSKDNILIPVRIQFEDEDFTEPVEIMKDYNAPDFMYVRDPIARFTYELVVPTYIGYIPHKILENVYDGNSFTYESYIDVSDNCDITRSNDIDWVKLHFTLTANQAKMNPDKLDIGWMTDFHFAYQRILMIEEIPD